MFLFFSPEDADKIFTTFLTSIHADQRKLSRKMGNYYKKLSNGESNK